MVMTLTIFEVRTVCRVTQYGHSLKIARVTSGPATWQGLDMFRDLRVTSISAREGLSEDSVNSVLASRDGTIWVGTAGHLEALGPEGMSSLPGAILHGKQVASLFEDHAGHLWVVMDNTLAIYQHRQFRQIKKQD